MFSCPGKAQKMSSKVLECGNHGYQQTSIFLGLTFSIKSPVTRNLDDSNNLIGLSGFDYVYIECDYQVDYEDHQSIYAIDSVVGNPVVG